jgi:iron complex transport system ATP-binding protein
MFSDEVMAIHNGKLIASGKPEEVISEDLFRKIYNIDTRILKIDGEIIVLPSKKGVG